MNKKELIEVICKNKGLNPESAGQELSWAYDYIFTAIVEAVASGEIVEVPDLGRLCRIKNYFGRDRVVFTPAPNFNDKVYNTPWEVNNDSH